MSPVSTDWFELLQYFFVYFYIEISFCVLIFILILFKKQVSYSGTPFIFLFIPVTIAIQLGFLVLYAIEYDFKTTFFLKVFKSGLLVNKYFYMFSSNEFQLKMVFLFCILLFLFFNIWHFKNVSNFSLRKINIEFIVLILSNVIFMLLALKSNNLFTLWVCLECISLTGYFLTLFGKSHTVSFTFLYFTFNSIAGACILWGMSLVTAFSSSEISFIFSTWWTFHELDSHQLMSMAFAIIMIILGFLVKLGLAPFHFWALETYENVTSEIFFFFMVFNKFILVISLIRVVNLFHSVVADLMLSLQPVFFIIFIISLIVGNLSAFNETNLQRFLAASSLPQLVYILFGVFTFNVTAVGVSILYLYIYLLTIIVIYYALVGLNRKVTWLVQLTGFYYFKQLFGLILIGAFLSLAGLPPFTTFFGKLFLLQVLLNLNYYGLAILILIFSIISLIYYLRICILILTALPEKAQYKFLKQSSEYNSIINLLNTVYPDFVHAYAPRQPLLIWTISCFYIKQLKFWLLMAFLQFFLTFGFIFYFDLLEFLLLKQG